MTDYTKVEKLAEKGDVASQCGLGAALAQGEELPKDPSGAVYWYNLAAKNGSVEALWNLGLIYFSELYGFLGRRDLGAELIVLSALANHTSAAKFVLLHNEDKEMKRCLHRGDLAVIQKRYSDISDYGWPEVVSIPDHIDFDDGAFEKPSI